MHCGGEEIQRILISGKNVSTQSCWKLPKVLILGLTKKFSTWGLRIFALKVLADIPTLRKGNLRSVTNFPRDFLMKGNYLLEKKIP